MEERRYWIGVVARNDVEAAVANGFVQLNYGKAGPLERMQPGDGVAFYSPRVNSPDGAPLQAFTAIGHVGAGPIFIAETSVERGGMFIANDAAPTFRRSAAWLEADAVPIKPLLDRLSFVRNKQHWGAAFRFGVLRVPREDFAAIAAAMGRDPDVDFA